MAPPTAAVPKIHVSMFVFQSLIEAAKTPVENMRMAQAIRFAHDGLERSMADMVHRWQVPPAFI